MSRVSPLPPAELGRWLALERFDYSRVGGQWAVLRLLAGLADQLGAPAQAMLVVTQGQRCEAFPARACALERRLGARQAGIAASELLWRASFAVPLEVVEFEETLFELTAAGRIEFVLPSPKLRTVTPQALRFTDPGARTGARSRGPAAGQMRHRIVALATAVAVTATSSPAVSLAATGLASNAPGGAPTGADAGQPGHDVRSALAGHDLAAATARVKTRARAHHKVAKLALDLSAAHPAKRRKSGSRTSAAKPAPSPAVTRATVTHVFSAPAQPSSPNTCPPKARGTYAHAAAGDAKRVTATHSLARRRSGPAGCSNHTTTAPNHGPTSTPPATTVTSTGPASTTPNVPTTTPSPPPATTAPTSPSPPPATTAPTSPSPPPATTAPTSPPNQPVTTSPSEPPANRPVSGGGHGAGRRSRSHARPRDTSGGAPVAPLGGLTSRPPVKLGSGSAGQTTSTPAGSTPQTTQLLSDSPATFSAPSSWTGSVSTDPSLAGALNNLSGLLANGDQPPAFLIPIYMEASRRYGVPWQVLAAINAIESDYGRDLSTSSAGALGWMQFEPSTWREYGKAVDDHSVANPYDPRDAIFAAAHYLAAAGAAHNISQAVFAYNHAGWYVDEVLSRARAIAANVHPGRMRIKRNVVSVYFANPWRKHHVAVYRGGVMSHYDRLIASANMVSAASFPYLYGGGHEQPALFGPFDCSGSVSYIVQQAGYRVPTTVSGDIPMWKFPAGPGRVTIFYNPTHTFMRIGNRFFGTSGFARPGGGAGWFDTATLPASYLAQFREVHIPRLGVNSFAPAKAPPTTPRSH